MRSTCSPTRASPTRRPITRGSVGEAVGGAQARHWSAGVAIYDIARPDAPRQIGFFPIEGVGAHRVWWVGGRYAYVSALIDGFTDYILLILDISDPTRPFEVGRYWLPGMNRAAGETPTWGAGRRFALHHGLVAGDTAYACWRDGGLTILDLADRVAAEARRPPQLVAALWRGNPFRPAAPRPRSADRRRRGGRGQRGGRA